MIYAREGEEVVCQNGHTIGTVARDIPCDDGRVICQDDLRDLASGVVFRDEEDVPGCPVCGAVWAFAYYRGEHDPGHNGGFYFRDGARVFTKGKIKKFRQHPELLP